MADTIHVTATPSLNGELVPVMAETQRFSSHLNIGRHEAIVLCVDRAMFNARKHGVDFNDPKNCIVLRFHK